MTIALWCVLIAGLQPYIWTIYAKSSKAGYDNHNPRAFLANLGGRGQRANWAQINSFEAFPLFAAAIITASFLSSVDQGTLDAVAVCFIVFRLLYGIFYITDRATLRSISWLGGLACCVAAFVLAA